MTKSLIFSLAFHLIMILLTALTLPFMVRQPVDLQPIVSVELIQISDKTNIPFSPKARKIIEEVIPYAEDPSIIYEHHWQTRDFLVWDNRSSTHARTDFPDTERRLLKRGMVEGAPLIGV